MNQNIADFGSAHMDNDSLIDDAFVQMFLERSQKDGKVLCNDWGSSEWRSESRRDMDGLLASVLKTHLSAAFQGSSFQPRDLCWLLSAMPYRCILYNLSKKKALQVFPFKGFHFVNLTGDLF